MRFDGLPEYRRELWCNASDLSRGEMTVPQSADMVNQSRRSRPPMLGDMVSIAAQRRKLARSLLECRLHGAKTLGNMDRSAPPNNQK
jgi:hypothetical protein